MFKALVSVALILAITASPLTITGNSSGENIVNLFEATRKTIPDTLPWYPLLVFGDNRPSNTDNVNFSAVFYTMIEEFKEIRPLAVIGTGDHVGMGYESQYRELYRVLNSSGLENVWLAMGNHDVEVYEGWSNWEKYVGPKYYYVDDIPGWRIGIGNTETRTIFEFQDSIENMYENIDNRSLILVLHRPVFPDVNHNLGSDRVQALLSIFREKGYPEIVLQGHWHGWGYQVKYNTTWIVTGGAGAPLYTYSVPQPSNGETVTGVYHYVVLILYPNQTYTFYPVKIGFGGLDVAKINETTYRVVNTKRDIHNNPVSMPIRIKYVVENREIYYVGIVPANSQIYVRFEEMSSGLTVLSNSSNWYVYLYNETSPDHSKVYVSINGRAVITYKAETETSTLTTTGNTPPTTAAPSSPPISYTSNRSAETLNTTSRGEPSFQWNLTLAVTTILFIIVASTVAWSILAKRR